ncbi:tetratricopeptide repeat protein [Polluticoccus soli]|uniref:tetratricopeptide repeat protein n=1 Tax=Polluticoccus soli TaxID=3034150 RepID=UPI0023E1B83A|nr:tetratricopeptide repeat protein [Flavipsychrobacter sp. JY13-12]
MSSKVPIAKNEFAWISLAPQLTVCGILVYIFWLLTHDLPISMMISGIAFYCLSLAMRAVLIADHKKGFKLITAGNFEAAIPYIEASLKHLTRNTWIDKYRYVALTSSRRTFREMDLCNIAFCYSQLGNLEMCKQYYQQAMDEYPNSTIASTALRFITTTGA